MLDHKKEPATVTLVYDTWAVHCETGQLPFEAPQQRGLYLHLAPESSQRDALRPAVSFDDRSVRLVGTDSPG